MRKPTVAALMLLALVAFAPSGVESQGLGGLIKKKAIEAVKGKDAKKDEAQTAAKDDGPITSRLGDCGPFTPDVVDRFLKGMEAELAERDEFERKRSSAKSDEEVRACRQEAAMGPEFQKLLTRGFTKEATSAQLQNAMARNMADVEAHLTKKCGEPASKYSRNAAWEAARQTAAKAARMSAACYDQLKEVALFFCKGLTSEQQNAATAQGIKAPGMGTAVWVYTADEAKALAPRCSQLIQQIEATGYRMG